jgi:hypothetical protein
MVAQEIEQEFGLAAAGTQMCVRDPDGAAVSDVTHRLHRLWVCNVLSVVSDSRMKYPLQFGDIQYACNNAALQWCRFSMEGNRP